MTQYLISITAAAVITLLIQKLLDGKGTVSNIAKMLCGIFLLLSILSPIADIKFSNLDDISFIYFQDGSEAVSKGATMANEQLRDSISKRVCAYILDKAEDYDARLSVNVVLSEDQIPVPISVEICGNISPYGKRQLQMMIEKDLGISQEDQIWI